MKQEMKQEMKHVRKNAGNIAKRIGGMMLVLLLVIGLLSGCGTSGGGNANAPSDGNENADEPESLKKHTVAVIFSNYNTANICTQNYYKDYLGPEFNVEFIFSEAISDTDAVLSFIENAYNSGAEAVMDLATTNIDGVEPALAKCRELGMFYAINMDISDADFSDYDNFAGNVTVNPESKKETYGQLTEYILDDGESHNVVLFTGASIYGNVGHISASAGVLEVLKDKYDLTYDADVEDLARSNSITKISTGGDVKICIVPLSQTRTDDMYSVLKDGEYDVVIDTAGLYADFLTPIDNVERAFGMDIKLITETAPSESTFNSFNTEDSTGNSTLNAASLSNSSNAGLLFALIYNSLNGDLDKISPENGSGATLFTRKWVCLGKESYETAKDIDTDGVHYTYRVDDIKEMIYALNPEINYEGLQDWADASEYSEVLKRNGLDE